jgi:hypothetical protein
VFQLCLEMAASMEVDDICDMQNLRLLIQALKCVPPGMSRRHDWRVLQPTTTAESMQVSSREARNFLQAHSCKMRCSIGELVDVQLEQDGTALMAEAFVTTTRPSPTNAPSGDFWYCKLESSNLLLLLSGVPQSPRLESVLLAVNYWSRLSGEDSDDSRDSMKRAATSDSDLSFYQ